MRTTETDQVTSQVPASFPTLQLLFSRVPLRRIVSLRPGTLEIGREVSDDTGLSLPEDGRASRRHALVDLRAAGSGATGTRWTVRVTDDGSKNGTFLNGVRIQSAELCDGDVLRIGNSLLLLRYEPARRVDNEIEALYGQAPSMRLLRARLGEAARLVNPVLVLGETGVGKEVTARAVHSLSERKGPLVTLNCAAIPEQLAESELFGHVAGAFSGAQKAYPGYFRAADGGTLFLDEIGELPWALQPKLLRALESREITPVGSTRSVAVDVRLIAATNRELHAEVEAGRFRGDLYARLRGHEIVVPPLRSRREDILPLLAHKMAPLLGERELLMTARLAEALVLYHWPYNVRELVQLAGCLEGAVRVGDELDLPLVAERLHKAHAAPVPGLDRESGDDAQPDAAPTSLGLLPPEELRLSREVLERLASEANWNISEMAKRAGRSRRQVRRWLEQHGLLRKNPAGGSEEGND